MERSVARITSILCIPFGYTVTLWCTGAWTVARHGLPGRADVLLFAGGAVAAFLVLGAVGRAQLDREVPMRVPALVVVNAFPVLTVAIVLVVPQAGIPRALAFLGSSFLATGLYIVSLATLVRLVERRALGRPGSADAGAGRLRPPS